MVACIIHVLVGPSRFGSRGEAWLILYGVDTMSRHGPMRWAPPDLFREVRLGGYSEEWIPCHRMGGRGHVGPVGPNPSPCLGNYGYAALDTVREFVLTDLRIAIH